MREESIESREVVVRLGPTTRPIQLSSGEVIHYAREALDTMVENARTRFLPQFVEHLHYLPPIGCLTRLRVSETKDEAYLTGVERRLLRGTAGDGALPRRTIAQAGHAEQLAQLADLELQISYEPRNFDPDDAANFEDAPIILGRHDLHADLPPLIWILTFGEGIAVAWASKYFLEAFMKRLGEALGNGLVDWLLQAARRAKRADRANLVECKFETASGVQVLAFCPFDPDSGPHVETLRQGIEPLGDVGLFCGSIERGEQPAEMRQVAFLWDGLRWQLCWWASDEVTFVTNWFRRNAPDPKRFLGRPLGAELEALGYVLYRDPDVNSNDTSERGDSQEPQSP